MSQTLTGRNPANTYKDLLQVSNSNTGIDGTLRPIADGEGTDSALQVSATAVRAAGPLDFAGTDHGGITLNNLTTTQRNALSAKPGTTIFNATTYQMETWNGSAWVTAGSGGAGAVTSVAGKTGAVTLTASDVSGLASVASTGNYADLAGKPTLFGGAYADLTGKPILGSAAALTAGSPNGVATLGSDGKVPADQLPAASGAVTSVAGRTGAVTLAPGDIPGLAVVASSGSYADLSNRPTFATVATSGAYGDLTGRPTLGTAAAQDATAFLSPTGSSSGLSVFGAAGANHKAGVVPDPGATAGATRVLHEDATWKTISALSPRRLPYATMATMGDSYAAIGYTNSATAKSYQNENIINWLRCYLGGRIHMPLENNLAVGATDAATAAASVDSVIATGADLVLLSTGRNNLQNGAYTWLQVVNIIMPAVKKLLEAGVDVLWPPVVQHTFNFNTTAIRQNRDMYNRFIYELCSGQRPDLAAAYGLPAGRLPMAVDMRFMWDNTTGYNLPDYILNDNTHGTARLWHEAVYRADGLGPTLDRRLNPRVIHPLPFDDIYDATNFPAGNLINASGVNDGLLAGTTGTNLTNAGVTPTGQVATRWQALRQLGDSTATFVSSKESPRADGMSGTGQVAQIAITSPGTVFAELYRYGYLGAGSNSISSGFAAGDKVYMHAQYELLGDPTGFLGAGISFGETVSSGSAQTAQDGQAGTGALARGPVKAYKGTLRTPTITIGASTTKLTPYLYMWVRGDTTSSLNIAWRDVAVRKANTY